MRISDWSSDVCSSDLKIGVVGIGGLGHMGIKIAHAMGAHVVAFTTSESKRDSACALGADEVVNSRNAAEMAAHAGSFDMILDTVAARSEEHTSELQSLMRSSYAVFCLKKKIQACRIIDIIRPCSQLASSPIKTPTSTQ